LDLGGRAAAGRKSLRPACLGKSAKAMNAPFWWIGSGQFHDCQTYGRAAAILTTHVAKAPMQ
jgi:nitrogen fixation-related uncharacterized protein